METVENLRVLPRSPYSPGPHAWGIALPPVGWALLHQPPSRTLTQTNPDASLTKAVLQPRSSLPR